MNKAVEINQNKISKISTIKSFHIKTFGCQMNEYDSSKMADILFDEGLRRSQNIVDADIIILNTCHIREKAAEKVYSELGRMKANIKKHYEKLGNETPKSQPLFAVAGCVAQAEGEEIMRRAPIVDIIVGPQNYHHLALLIKKYENGAKRIIDIEFPVEDKFKYLKNPHMENINLKNPVEGLSNLTTSLNSKPINHNQNLASFSISDTNANQINPRVNVSAHLAVQEGCDKFCTFCVVPYTRGAEFSRSVEEIIDEAKKLAELGVKEITLLGQNVNAYHGLNVKGNEVRLAKLIELVSEIDGIERIRYTTSHPCDIDDELLNVHGELPKLMPYLHLPIQSGSNNILKKMNRNHTTDAYINIIERLRKARPDIALTSDFIVGFPGESDDDFEATLNLVRQINYASAYSFKYSKRPGTKAHDMDNQIDEELKSERLYRLQELLNQQKYDFNNSQINKDLTILVSAKGRKEGQLTGRSPYLQPVHFVAGKDNIGKMVNVKITGAGLNSLSASIISP